LRFETKVRLFFILLLFTSLLFYSQPVLAQAQEPSLLLRIRRDFGYGGFNNDIEGIFSLHAEGPDDLERVDFYIDDILIGWDAETPFRVQFSTGDYAPGEHHMHAIGFTYGGAQLASNEIVRLFLTDEEARGKVGNFVLPLLGILAAIMILTVAVLALFIRRKPELGRYGFSGGAVCPNCGVSFARNLFALHLGGRHLERCPHCGKWSWVRRASAEELRAADVRWRYEGGEIKGESGKERLKRQIDGRTS
jgi:hypothetical protein